MTVGVQGIGLPARPAASPKGSVPTPDGRFLYVPNTDSNHRTINAFQVDASTGVLTSVGGSPFAATGDQLQLPAVHPSGRFLYVASATGSVIDAHTIDSATGALSALAGSPFATGTGPGPVRVDPGGSFLYVPNYNGGGGSTLSAYRIDPSSGALSAVEGSPFATGTGPSEVRLVATLGYY